MNILFITIAWPESGERNLYTDLIDEFILKGHSVIIVGTHSSSNLKGSLIQKEIGKRILLVHSRQIRKASHVRKAMSLLLLNRKMYGAVYKFFKYEKVDLIIGHTPPVTFSSLYKKLKKLYSSSLYLLLKDIWPQGSVDLQVFSKFSPIWFYLRFHEVRTYKIADYIGTMSPKNAEYLLIKNHFLANYKVEVCPNSIRPSSIENNQFNVSDIRRKYGIPEGACVFIFSGNLARGHGLDFLIEVINRMSYYTKAYFVIGGSGTHYSFLEKALNMGTKGNFLLYKWLPKEDFNKILRTSDVGLILLDSKFTIPQFPSRLLSYLDAAKPVLCAVNENTDIGSIIENEGCGRSVIHGDSEAFINQIIYFSESKEKRLEMGEKSRQLLLNQYDVSRSCEIILKHFNERDYLK